MMYVLSKLIGGLLAPLGARAQVVKNTALDRAAQQLGWQSLAPLLTGLGGMIYLAVSGLGGIGFIGLALRLYASGAGDGAAFVGWLSYFFFVLSALVVSLS